MVRYASCKGYRNISLLYPASQYGAAIEQALSRSALSEGSTVVAAKSYAREAAAVTQPAASIAASLSGQGRALSPARRRPDAAHRQRRSRRQTASARAARRFWAPACGMTGSPAPPPLPRAAGMRASPRNWCRPSNRNMWLPTAPSRRASPALPMTRWPLPSSFKKTGDVSKWASQVRSASRAQNGLFRFRENGLIERGLAILQMGPGGPDVIQQAPTSFSAPVQ